MRRKVVVSVILWMYYYTSSWLFVSGTSCGPSSNTMATKAQLIAEIAVYYVHQETTCGYELNDLDGTFLYVCNFIFEMINNNDNNSECSDGF